MFRKDLWKSYDEYCLSSEVEEIAEREFPVDAHIFSDGISRRHFFKIMGASLALAGLSSCRFIKAEKIVSFVKAPEGLVPGESVFYARSFNRGGHAVGVLVESYMGRPIKVEGNPEHPMSLGASDILLQSEILNLYDPDRLRRPLKNRMPETFSSFEKECKEIYNLHKEEKGAGLFFLCEVYSSPTRTAEIKKIKARFPLARIVYYDPLEKTLLKEATNISFGKFLLPFYDFTKAKVILSIDCDFFSDDACGLRYSRDFSDQRRKKEMNRLYSIESDHTLTGAMADHRLARSRNEIEKIIERLAVKLDIALEKNIYSDHDEKWLTSVVQDLKDHAGSSLIIAGENLRPEYQSLIFLMNEKLNNLHSSLHFYQAEKESYDLVSLVGDMNRGLVKSLIILSSNPVYTAPADLHFKEALKKVSFSACLTMIESETSKECVWTIPQSHSLESWSDGRALDGTLSINQPLIAPLFDSWSELELLSLISDGQKKDTHELVKDYWKTNHFPFNEWWESALRMGVVENSSYPKEKRQLNAKKILTFFAAQTKQQNDNSPFELHLKADPTLLDGRFANNGWLQELPKPMSKLCWSNAAFISPSLAKKFDLENGNIVALHNSAGRLEVPVWILPGLASEVIILHYGHGRSSAGRVGTGVGSNAFFLLHSKNREGIERGITLQKTGRKTELACTQEHHSFSDRDPIHVYDIKKYPLLTKEKPQHKSLYEKSPLPPSKDYSWGMSIDLNVCTGCNACVIGCQAENNVPIVGEEEVKRGREMHWIRVDRYFDGTPDLARAHFQPLACVHCEKAPCEVVCPVAATSHSTEGINQMVYNRCVGTRYCSNNCPYKVRRFNFFEYHQRENEFLKMRMNPEVTVRSRGVMEKCTYCIQRINEKRVTAELEGRKIKDGEIKTACEQACATKAIVFGNLLDKNSEVSKRHNEKESYELLGELGTLPRTQYLARFKNPHPEIV